MSVYSIRFEIHGQHWLESMSGIQWESWKNQFDTEEPDERKGCVIEQLKDYKVLQPQNYGTTFMYDDNITLHVHCGPWLIKAGVVKPVSYCGYGGRITLKWDTEALVSHWVDNIYSLPDRNSV